MSRYYRDNKGTELVAPVVHNQLHVREHTVLPVPNLRRKTTQKE